MGLKEDDSQRHIRDMPNSLRLRTRNKNMENDEVHDDAFLRGVQMERQRAIAELNAGRSPTDNAPDIRYGANRHRSELHGAVASFLLRNAGIHEDRPHPGRDDFDASSPSSVLLEFVRHVHGKRYASVWDAWQGTQHTRASPTDSTNFPLLMADVLNRAARDGWSNSVEQWRQFTSYVQVPDFRETHLQAYELGALSGPIAENATIPQEVPGETSESGSAKTFAKIIYISRKSLVGSPAFDVVRQAQALGRSAARSVGSRCVAILESNPTLSDGVATFHASHGNLISAGPPNSTTWAAVWAAMSAQEDASSDATSESLNLQPAVALVPGGNAYESQALRNACYQPGANPNDSGSFLVVPDGRLTANWYALGNPAFGPGLSVLGLDSELRPSIETMEQVSGEPYDSFTTDGTAWRCMLYYDVAVTDHRSLCKIPLA